MIPRHVGVLLMAPLLASAGAQRDVFTKPVRLAYGDKTTIAPMMAPSLTLDWDRDGRPDLALDTFAVPDAADWDGDGKIDHQPKRTGLRSHAKGWGHFAMCEPVDLGGDGHWEVIAGVDRGAIYYWRE